MPHISLTNSDNSQVTTNFTDDLADRRVGQSLVIEQMAAGTPVLLSSYTSAVTELVCLSTARYLRPRGCPHTSRTYAFDTDTHFVRPQSNAHTHGEGVGLVCCSLRTLAQ